MNSPGARWRLTAPAIVMFYFVVVVVLQWAGGAYRDDMGGQGDDSAHYVTGLMVRDYIAAGLPAPPMQFAKDYYLHYPKVGLGHWPPLFYLVEGVWMLLFSPSKISVMLLMALLTTLLALTACLAVAQEFGRLAGTAAGLLLICLPAVQELTGTVMPEVAAALLGFWAVLFFAKFLDSRRWTDSAAFGVFASLAILTHGIAFFLVFVPPIAAAIQRRFRLLVHPHFWIPAAIVIVLCGPWYYLAPGARHEFVAPAAGLFFRLNRIVRTPSDLLQMTGAVLFVIILLGLIIRTLLPILKGRAPGARWASAAAAILGLWLFRTMVSPSAGIRHVVVIAPAAMMFLAGGLAWLASMVPVPGLGLCRRQVMLASIAALAFCVGVFAVPKQTSHGLAAVAEDLWIRPEFQDSVFLVSSDAASREGQFIAAMAMYERRPGHFVLRASKVLAKSGWLGDGYVVRYPTPTQMMQYLESVPVGVLVMEGCPAPRKLEHQRVLQKMVQLYPQKWRLAGSYPCEQGRQESVNSVLVYSLLGRETGAAPRIRLDMRNRLNEFLVNGEGDQ